jgi:hypothetical protein
MKAGQSGSLPGSATARIVDSPCNGRENADEGLLDTTLRAWCGFVNRVGYICGLPRGSLNLERLNKWEALGGETPGIRLLKNLDPISKISIHSRTPRVDRF